MVTEIGPNDGMFDILQIADNLNLSPEGIWVAPRSTDFMFLPNDETDWVQIQQHSFWYRHRNDCLKELFKSFPPRGIALEVGAGDGFVSLGLQQAGVQVVAIEPDIKRARNAKRRGVESVISARLEDVEWKPACVGGVGLFDVLEHIDDEIIFLRRVRRLLKSGGRLYVSVPTYQWLWSKEDDEAHHLRRYTLDRLRKTLEVAGFMVEYTTYFFSALAIPILLLRSLPTWLGIRLDRTHLSSCREHHPKLLIVSNILNYFLSREVQAIRNKSIKIFGASCLVVASSLSNESKVEK